MKKMWRFVNFRWFNQQIDNNGNNRLRDYILILSFASLLYLNSLDADFAYDDNRAILNNQDVLSTTPWYHLFINDFWGTPIQSSNSHGSYRPITVVSFRLNHMIHGHTPFGFHLVNLLLHLIVTLLYTIFIERLLNGRRQRRITLIASLLFASHPIHVESVTSIVGRADVGAALFYLLALYFYVKFVESNNHGQCRKYLCYTIVMATFSMLTKEHGITCLLLCIIYHLFIVHHFFPFNRQNWTKILRQQEYGQLRRGIRTISIALIIMIIFRLSIHRYRPSFSSADNPISDNPSVMVRFLTFHYLPVFNFWLLIYPQWLSFDWSMDAIPLIVSWFDRRNIFTFIFYAIIIEFARRTLYYYSLVSSPSSSLSISASNNNIRKRSNHQCIRCDNFQIKNLYQQQQLPQPSFEIDSNNNNVGGINYNHQQNQQPFAIFDLNNNDPQMPNQNEPIIDLNNNNNNNFGRSSLPPPKQTIISQSTTQCKQSKYKLVKGKKLSEIDCIVLSLAMMIVPFLPATNLFFYIGFVVAERILYIPSFGFCLFIAVCVEKFIQYVQRYHLIKYIIYLCYLILIISFSIRTILRNIDWLTEENLYRSGIVINPPKAYGNLANILSQQGRNDEAEQMYRKALEYRINMADVHYNLGLLLQNEQRYNEAIHCYQQAIRFRPRLAMAYLNIGVIYSRLGDKNRAKQFYEKCSQLDNYGLKDIRNHEITRISALYNLGQLFLDDENYIEALKIYRQAIFQIPSYYQPHSLYNKIAEVYNRMNRTADAEIWFRKSLTIKHDHIPAYLTYARMLIKTNRTFEAEQLYRKAMLLSSNDTAIYHHYGQFKFNNGQLKDALAIYMKGFESFPNDCDIVINVANILRQLQQPINAEIYYKLATKLRPNDLITHSNLGAIYHLNGKFKLAKQSYQRALELKPDDNITKINLARLDRIIIAQQKS
nr:protein O-mannosyl-transferase TMTC2-like [Dermatophagoides farinae]XP_046917033.1 protein O-mannosyl-transferase TMTC2-like [Dermatophagoides farinae]